MDAGEECDDGRNDGGYNGCTEECKRASYCGDGHVDEGVGEVCDPGEGNFASDYGGCEPSCRSASHCGDGLLNGPEQCDLGKDANNGAASGCNLDCTRYQDPTAVSGSRLKRRYLDAGMGAQATLNFWDSKLEFECSFREAADGEQRCLPDRDTADDILFLDAGCEQPVYDEHSDSCESSFAIVPFSGSIFRRTSVPVSVEGKEVYLMDFYGNCRQTSIPKAVYWVPEFVHPSEFVRGEVEDVVHPSGLISRYLNGEDGSRTLKEVLNGELAYRCEFDGEGYCLPPDVSFRVETFLDPGCTLRVDGYEKDRIPTILPIRLPLCEPVEYFEVGARVTVTERYKKNSSGSCIVDPGPSTYEYYKRGAPIPRANLPRAEIRHEGTGSLLASRFWSSEGKPIGHAHAFWDPAINERCEYRNMADGTFACIPGGGFIDAGEHLDANCLDSDMLVRTRCQATVPRLAVRLGYHTCRRHVEAVYETGAQLPSRSYYFKNEYVTCEQRESFQDVTHYRTGANVTAQLPVLELVTEP